MSHVKYNKILQENNLYIAFLAMRIYKQTLLSLHKKELTEEWSQIPRVQQRRPRIWFCLHFGSCFALNEDSVLCGNEFPGELNQLRWS